MPSHDTFLELINESPSDSAPQLIYADWLDEQGDPRGELIRLLVEMRNNPVALSQNWDQLTQNWDHPVTLIQNWDPFVQATKACFEASEIEVLIGLLEESQKQLFACQCAESVLHHYENAFPDDLRPRNAIEVARRFAKGQAPSQDLVIARSVKLGSGKSWLNSGEFWDPASGAACVATSATGLPGNPESTQIRTLRAAADTIQTAYLAVRDEADLEVSWMHIQIWVIERLLKFRVD